jgi:hypothetical protein
MKKKNNTILFAIGGILAYLLLFRGKASAQGSGNSTGPTGAVSYNSSCTSNCTTFTGILAGQSVTMKITGQNTSITGDYIYNSIALPIKLAELSRNANTIEVNETYNNAVTGKFSFNLFNDTATNISGTWKSPDGSRTFNFNLTKV